MLRRRKKSPKPDRRPAPAPNSRRRARLDAFVPAELIIDRSKSSSAVVLITGFEPFGGERTNPSWDIVERLPDTIAGLRVARLRVPCEFRRAIEVAAVAIEKPSPNT